MWVKVSIGCAGIFVITMMLVCGGLIYIGIAAPDTKAIPGPQMRESQVRTIRSLGLIDADETIRYFYSDGLLDVKEGMYFYTDRKAVLYMKNAAEKQIIVPFEDIISIEVEYSDSWFTDSTIWLETETDYITMPVCNEAGGDRRFYDGLVAAWKRHNQSKQAQP